MKTNYRIFLSLVLLAGIITACQREPRDIGAADGPLLGSPSYQSVAQVSTVAVAGNIPEVAPKVAQAEALDPAALYTKNCAACHQATGLGIPSVFPPLDASPYVTGENTERLASILLYGLVGPVKVLGVQYASAMAGLGATVSDEELAQIATHIRSNWSNSAGPVEVSVFAAARTKWGSRGPFNIQELGEEQ